MADTENKKVVTLESLTTFKGEADKVYAPKSHTHTMNEISDISSVYRYQGTVNSNDALPSNPSVGDVYNVGDSPNGMNFAWNGTAWDSLGTTVDISGKQDKLSETQITNINKDCYTKTEVDGLLQNVSPTLTYATETEVKSIFTSGD